MISFLEKISISFVVITIVTIMIVLMFLDVNKAREDINGIKSHMLSLDNYQTKLSQIFFQISGTYPQLRLQEGLTIKEFGGKIKNTFSKGGTIDKGIKDPIKQIKKFIDTVNNAFKSIPRRFGHLNRAFEKAGDGIKLQFVNLGKSLDIGFSDIFALFSTLGNCGINTLTKSRAGLGPVLNACACIFSSMPTEQNSSHPGTRQPQASSFTIQPC